MNVADEKEPRLGHQPNQLVDHKFMANLSLDGTEKTETPLKFEFAVPLSLH